MTVPEPSPSLVEAIRDRRALALIGSGLSRAAGAPSWTELLHGIARAAEATQPAKRRAVAEALSILDQGRFLDAAELLGIVLGPEQLRDETLRQLGAPRTHEPDSEAIPKALKNESVESLFRKRKTASPAFVSNPTESHYMLVQAGFRGLVTTNYDRLLEETFHGAIRYPTYSCSAPNFPQVVRAGKPFLLKLHGDEDHPSDLVLTRSDYLRVVYASQARQSLLPLFQTHTLFWVGYGHNDPDLDLLVDRLLAETKLGGGFSVLRSGDGATAARLLAANFSAVELATYDDLPAFLRKLMRALDKPVTFPVTIDVPWSDDGAPEKRSRALAAALSNGAVVGVAGWYRGSIRALLETSYQHFESLDNRFVSRDPKLLGILREHGVVTFDRHVVSADSRAALDRSSQRQVDPEIQGLTPAQTPKPTGADNVREQANEGEIQISIPADGTTTFQWVAQKLCERRGKTVHFIGFTEEQLKAPLRPQRFGPNSLEALLEGLSDLVHGIKMPQYSLEAGATGFTLRAVTPKRMPRTKRLQKKLEKLQKERGEPRKRSNRKPSTAFRFSYSEQEPVGCSIAFIQIPKFKSFEPATCLRALLTLHDVLKTTLDLRDVRILNAISGAIIVSPDANHRFLHELLEPAVSRLAGVKLPIRIGVVKDTVRALMDVDGSQNFIGRALNIAARLANPHSVSVPHNDALGRVEWRTLTAKESQGIIFSDSYTAYAAGAYEQSALKPSKGVSVRVHGKPHDPPFACQLCVVKDLATETEQPDTTSFVPIPKRVSNKNGVLIAFDLPQFSKGDLALVSDRFRSAVSAIRAARLGTDVPITFSPGGDGGVLFLEAPIQSGYEQAERIFRRLGIDSLRRSKDADVQCRIGLHFGMVQFFKNAEGVPRPTGLQCFIADDLASGVKPEDGVVFSEPFRGLVTDGNDDVFDREFRQIPSTDGPAQNIRRYVRREVGERAASPFLRGS